MIPGLSGSLLSHEALADVVPRVLNGLLGEPERETARRSLRAWHLPLRAHLGPALSLRAIYDRLADPLFAEMGYHVVPVDSLSRGTGAQPPTGLRAVLSVSGVPRATLFVTLWGDHSAATWRDTVRLGISQNGRWCFCLSGPRLRIVDSSRTYSRQFAEFDLEMALDREETFGVFWGLMRGAAMEGTSGDARPLLERAIEARKTGSAVALVRAPGRRWEGWPAETPHMPRL